MTLNPAESLSLSEFTLANMSDVWRTNKIIPRYQYLICFHHELKKKISKVFFELNLAKYMLHPEIVLYMTEPLSSLSRLESICSVMSDDSPGSLTWSWSL